MSPHPNFTHAEYLSPPGKLGGWEHWGVQGGSIGGWRVGAWEGGSIGGWRVGAWEGRSMGGGAGSMEGGSGAGWVHVGRAGWVHVGTWWSSHDLICAILYSSFFEQQ